MIPRPYLKIDVAGEHLELRGVSETVLRSIARDLRAGIFDLELIQPKETGEKL